MKSPLKCSLLIILIGSLMSVTAFAQDKIKTQDINKEPQYIENSVLSDCTAINTVSDLMPNKILAKAKGQECPTGSGKYCSVHTPVCCMIKGEWKCKKTLAD
ncbi:MAG: hypothetical protein HY879_19475 [Deltaproteobacteria bacterium]|nr:hypothetical protein [Deltaproteobacteria bacterium]